MGENTDKTVKRIILEYEDGSTEAFNEGLVFCIKETKLSKDYDVLSHIVGMTKEELATAVDMSIMLGEEYDLFDDEALEGKVSLATNCGIFAKLRSMQFDD